MVFARLSESLVTFLRVGRVLFINVVNACTAYYPLDLHVTQVRMHYLTEPAARRKNLIVASPKTKEHTGFAERKAST